MMILRTLILIISLFAYSTYAAGIHDQKQQHNDLSPVEPGLLEVASSQSPAAAAFSGTPSSSSSSAPVAPEAPQSVPKTEDPAFDPSKRARNAFKRRVKVGFVNNPEHEEEVLTWTESFTFVPGKASTGHVLLTRTGLTVEALAELCHNTKHCTGFTTDGELKSFVPARAKWVDLKTDANSPTVDVKEQGLYYRPQWFRFAPVPCVCGTSPLLNLVCTDPGRSDSHLGEALEDWSCYNPKPFLARHTCPASSCVAISWKTSEWSGCPSCGVASNTRTVTCADKDGVKFPEKLCYETGPRPAEKEACTATGVACEWDAKSNGCATPCGRGIESFNITCISPVDKKTVDDKLCLDTKPAAQRTCRASDCAWSTTPSGACSRPCGPGVQPLKSVCINPADPAQTLSDLQCDNIPRPKGTQPCNARDCSWDSIPVGTCSTPCGRGLQALKNTCIDPVSKERQPRKSCTASPPPSHTHCENRACVWGLTPFKSCSAQCGVGLQHFNVTCQDPVSRLVVSGAYCTGAKPDAKPEKCTMHACHWRSVPRTKCSAACGKGTQEFSVFCVDPVTGAQLPESECPTAKPAATRECMVRACQWDRKKIGECSAPCGSGVQSFDVKCINPENGDKQPEESCADVEKPASVQPCRAKSECRWNAVVSGKCDAICGEGKVNRTVSCIDPRSKKRVADSMCTGIRPHSEATCYDRPCVWTANLLGECSAPCGVGVQKLNITCTDPSGRSIVGSDRCRSEVKPKDSQPCFLRTCRWAAKPNDDCANTCGPSTRTVTVTCQDPVTKAPQNESNCEVKDKPATSMTCQLKPCSWETDKISACSQPCGDGVAKVTHKCVDPITKKSFNESSCNNVPRPAGEVACHVRDCQWNRKWNECPVKCGGGVQTAALTCQDTDGTEVSNTQCRTAPRAWRLCNTQACVELPPAFTYLRFNDASPVTGSRIRNFAPNSDHGTANGAGLESVPGARNNSRAVKFSANAADGRGSAVVLPAHAKFQAPSFSITFTIQLLENLTPGRQYILLDNRALANGGEGYVLFLEPKDGQIYFNDAFNAQTNVTHFASSGAPLLVDGKFHQIIVTYNGNTGDLKFFMDGKLTSAADAAHKFPLSTNISEHTVYVRGSPDPYWRAPVVALQDFAQFDYVLNEKQLALVSGFFTEASVSTVNQCSATERLTAGGCIPVEDPAHVLKARCNLAKGPHSIEECLLPLWGLSGCSSLGFGYPGTELPAKHFDTKSWKEVVREVRRAAADDVDEPTRAGKRFGICKNRLASPLDSRCNHPPPFSLSGCLQSYFLDVGCDRGASAFPKDLNVGWNKLSWSQVKHRMAALPALDVRGNKEYGTCKIELE